MANKTPSFSHLQKHRRAFTLLEVSFTIAVFALFAVGSIYAMTQANRFASNSRYRTLALAAAQQKIDQVMTAGWSMNPGSTPAQVLRVDAGAAQSTGNVTTTVNTTDVQATTVETSIPINSDPFNAETGLGSAFTSLDVKVIDSRTTVITRLTDCTGNTGKTSRLVRADVTVTYTYRGKQVTVAMSTLRTADDF